MIKTNKINIRKRMPRDLKYERAKLMFQYRYIQNMTLERIGRMFGMTRESVRQIIGDYKESLKQLDFKLDKTKKVE